MRAREPAVRGHALAARGLRMEAERGRHGEEARREESGPNQRSVSQAYEHDIGPGARIVTLGRQAARACVECPP